MDDFAQQINRFGGGKDLPGGVSQIDGPFHAVTKAKFLGQFDGEQPIGRQDVALVQDAIDQIAAIMGHHLGLHRLHHIRSAEVNLLRRSTAIAIGFRV